MLGDNVPMGMKNQTIAVKGKLLTCALIIPYLWARGANVDSLYVTLIILSFYMYLIFFIPKKTRNYISNVITK